MMSVRMSFISLYLVIHFTWREITYSAHLSVVAEIASAKVTITFSMSNAMASTTLGSLQISASFMAVKIIVALPMKILAWFPTFCLLTRNYPKCRRRNPVSLNKDRHD